MFIQWLCKDYIQQSAKKKVVYDYAYFAAVCVELRIDLSWMDRQNPYVILNILKHINKMRNPDANKKKATAADIKDFVREG